MRRSECFNFRTMKSRFSEESRIITYSFLYRQPATYWNWYFGPLAPSQNESPIATDPWLLNSLPTPYCRVSTLYTGQSLTDAQPLRPEVLPSRTLRHVERNISVIICYFGSLLLQLTVKIKKTNENRLFDQLNSVRLTAGCEVLPYQNSYP